MAIKIPQSLDLSKKALSQSLRLVSSEHSQNQNVAPPNSKKEIKNHLKLNKASDEKLALAKRAPVGVDCLDIPFLKRVRTKWSGQGGDTER
ncbi:hypothetical protein ACVDG9_27750 [Roseibium sp. RP-7]